MTRFPRARTGRSPRVCRRRGKSRYEISRRAGGDPGFPGLYGPSTCPAPRKPRRLAVLETDGWAVATPAAKDGFRGSVGKTQISRRHARVASRERKGRRGRGRDPATRGNSPMNIITWESRWPINTYRARDASKLSQAMLERCARAEAMTLDDYRRDIEEREERRDRLSCAGGGIRCLHHPGGAQARPRSASVRPGTRRSCVQASMLGVPAISLPVLQDEGLPLGLQLLGCADRDAALFSTAGGVLALME